MKVTLNLATDGSSIFVAPFSALAGAAALGGNIAISPIMGLFYKGSPIYFSQGSVFEIKLIQDLYIYK